MANQEAKEIVIAMVPYPAQSHLNCFFQLSHVISSYYNLKVHFLSSSRHNSQVKSRAAIQNPNPNIIFHDLPIPDYPSTPVPRTKTMSHFIPSVEASLALRNPATSLLSSLAKTAKRLVLIFDPLMSFVVQDACVFPNSESYLIFPISAISKFGLTHDKEREDIPSSSDCFDSDYLYFLNVQVECLKKIKVSGSVINTCRVIESEFLDMIEEENVKQWAVGPLETVTEFKNRAINDGLDHECLEWLNKQEDKSVLYVSFGTTTFMDDEQIREIAIGLEQSGVKFIWVLRDADRDNIFDGVEARRFELPMGFEERMERLEMGMVVREWVPQLEILGHSATGGFMSHCGWNSCLESLSLGVPIAAWPVYGDQPMNAALVVNKLKVGFDVREWEKREELVSSSMISEVGKRLMKSEEGDEMRKRTEELGLELRKCTKKGGVSQLELDSFVAHITRV